MTPTLFEDGVIHDLMLGVGIYGLAHIIILTHNKTENHVNSVYCKSALLCWHLALT